MSERKTILVVDDDQAVREMIVEYLNGAGFMVVAAADVDGMRQQLTQHRVDLVLLDRTMPSGDALELVPELRQRQGLGVILVTALAEEEERVRGLEVGADDYIIKPFNWRELTARVQAVIRLDRRSQPSPAGGHRRGADATVDAEPVAAPRCDHPVRRCRGLYPHGPRRRSPTLRLLGRDSRR